MRTSPTVAWTLSLLAVSAAIAGGAVYALEWRLTLGPLVVSWVAALTLVTLAAYGFDKRQAARAGRRIPEATLHTLTAAGGSMGAYLGMRLFRHKTIKGEFRAMFWAIVAVQVVLLGWAAKSAWGTTNAR